MLTLTNNETKTFNGLTLQSCQEYTCHDCFNTVLPSKEERPSATMPGHTFRVYAAEYHHPGFTPDGVKYWTTVCKPCHLARLAA